MTGNKQTTTIRSFCCCTVCDHYVEGVRCWFHSHPSYCSKEGRILNMRMDYEGDYVPIPDWCTLEDA